MMAEGRCSFHESSGGSRMGPGRGVCQFDRAHTDCDGDTRHCRRLEFLKQYLMGREWMKVGTKSGKTKHYLGEEWERKEMRHKQSNGFFKASSSLEETGSPMARTKRGIGS